MKLFWLNIKRVVRRFLKGVGYYISIIFLIVSISISLMLLIPQCFHRAPIYSYFVTELTLPISYTLTGNVKILDVNNNILVGDITVCIGGYSTNAELDGAFSLRFTAANATDIPVVIYYTSSNGRPVTHVENLELKEGVYTIQREFLLHE